MENHTVKRALVAVIIERTLNEFGKAEYKEVENRLESEYGIYFTDCLENPEYFKRIIQDIYGNAHKQILEKINDYLGDLREQKDYSDFIKILEHTN
ncbi:MAG: hypothetical protein DWQ18_01585 [Crenarchaeota archaeon]|nr:MAG: hypothetical protein DWQ17_06945 [Thermoproteota archaeon]RDJ33648.1 MAG: hypothetical protein DWQ18_01585 [Thermoproteota archaeon]RDJ37226.1 MAG: hypothetical protein DWQ19_01795 [Thermoproteota archaeon]RDJ39180.1 MAG: hypothetical protein DWQ13_02685 [Thermoproteota archaeon]